MTALIRAILGPNWNTSLMGVLFATLLAGPELHDLLQNFSVPSEASDSVDWRQLLLGAVAVVWARYQRDGNKSSEDVGVKPSSPSSPPKGFSWLLLLAPTLLLVGGCAGRSTVGLPGGGKAASLGVPNNSMSVVDPERTETQIGPVVQSRTEVSGDQYLTHGPGQASSIIVQMFRDAAQAESGEQAPIRFDVQTVANWRAGTIKYDPVSGMYTIEDMEVSASAILDATNAIYPEVARMVEVGALTEQQAWQVMSAVLQKALEVAGDALVPIPTPGN